MELEWDNGMNLQWTGWTCHSTGSFTDSTSSFIVQVVSFHVPFQPNQLEWNGGMEWWNGMVEWNGGMEWWNGMEFGMVECRINILSSTYSVFLCTLGSATGKSGRGKTHRRHQTKIDFTDEIFFLRRLFLYPMEIAFDGSWGMDEILYGVLLFWDRGATTGQTRNHSGSRFWVVCLVRTRRHFSFKWRFDLLAPPNSTLRRPTPLGYSRGQYRFRYNCSLTRDIVCGVNLVRVRFKAFINDAIFHFFELFSPFTCHDQGDIWTARWEKILPANRRIFWFQGRLGAESGLQVQQWR